MNNFKYMSIYEIASFISEAWEDNKRKLTITKDIYTNHIERHNKPSNEMKEEKTMILIKDIDPHVHALKALVPPQNKYDLVCLPALDINFDSSNETYLEIGGGFSKSYEAKTTTYEPMASSGNDWFKYHPKRQRSLTSPITVS